MHKILLGTLISVLLISGCVQDRCGDGICQRGEERGDSCPQDCASATTISLVEEDACKVKSLERIGEGSFPKYSPDGSRIAFTREINDNDYQIYTMNPDGSDVKCLTCDKAGLSATRWRGQPYWHPNGEYIVFTAETTKYPRKGIGVSTRPGIGRNHNVWIMRSDASTFWQMTDYEENWGVIRPSFSHDGETLYWNEEYMMEKYPEGKSGLESYPGCYWGHASKIFRMGEELCAWRVKLADISFETEAPVISNIRHIDPPEGFTLIEGTGFTSNDDGFVYSYCNIKEQGGQCFWGNVYISNLDGTGLIRLTNDFRKHNENPEMSPDGRKILYNHGEGNPGDGEEIWLMNSDGSNKEQLTHFTAPSYPEYNPNARQTPESTWSPDGAGVVFAHVNQERESGLGPHIPGELYRLNFEGACGNQGNDNGPDSNS